MTDKTLQSLIELPDQFEQAFREVQDIDFPKEYSNAKNILVCGMGGSRFPALIVYHAFKEGLKAPIVVNDEYRVPLWVDEDTLVVLSSYSGTTEEVVFNAEEIFGRTKLITAITTGGRIGELMETKGVPFYKFDPKHNPSAQPRMGVGYSVGALFGLLYKLKLLEVPDLRLDEALSFFREAINRLVEKKDDTADKLAEEIFGRFPFYVVGEFLEGLGKALANQTNETAKSIAAYHVIPELNHHLMEGLKNPSSFRDLALFVFFESDLYHPRVIKRFRITKEVVEKNKIKTISVKVKGRSVLEQAFYFMGLSSLLTYRLSQKYGEKPEEIPFVDYFKKKLAEND